MENIFSLQRFWLLVRKHANDNWEILIVSPLLMILPSVLFQLLSHKLDLAYAYYFYLAFLVLIGGGYTSSFFEEWSLTSSASSVLMLPSSAFEKIALVFFFTVMLLIPVFTLLYYGPIFIGFKFSNPGIPFLISDVFQGHTFLGWFGLSVLVPYITFQSFFLLFAVWLKKRHFVTALRTILGLYIAVTAWNINYLHWLSGSKSIMSLNHIVFFPTSVTFSDQGIDNAITSDLISNISTVIFVVITLLFYVASYYKLKEKKM